MKKILILLVFASAMTSCKMKWLSDDNMGTIITKADAVKIISYNLFEAYYEAEIQKITYEITYAGLSETDAWAKKKALDLKAVKYKEILNAAQNAQILLAVALDAKNINPDDPQLPQKITEHTIRLMGLVGQMTALITDIKGGTP